MSTPKITEATIRRLSTPQSFERGEDYYHTGAVSELIRRGDILSAAVQGSDYDPYTVRLELSDDGVVAADCTCPYDWGGYCKHIVAVLLACLHDPDQISERPSVTELLAGLGRDELLGLLTAILSQQPHLISWVEQQLASQAPQPEPASPASAQASTPSLDSTPFRRRAQDIMSSLRGMRPSEAYGYTGDIARQVSDLLHQADPFIDAGDGRNALLILEAVTQVYKDRWLDFDDSDGELGALFSDIGALFAEAILSADLSPQERQAWADKLTAWQGEVDDYGIDEAFDLAIVAAVQGWDYPPLQAVLRGQVTGQGAWEDEAPWYADDLALIRLRILARQGKTTEYLYLAEAEGQTALYLAMLVKLNRLQEALDYASSYLATADEAFAFAKTLQEHNHPQDALHMAERGLALPGQTYPLACWLRDFAAVVGQPALALRAAQVAFAASPTLENYQAVERIAGTEWPAIKRDLLKTLAARDNTSGKIDIYLHEGLAAEAIKVVDSHPYLGFDELRRVVDAAGESNPDWAIRQARKQAESIMDRGQSKYYHHAVDWLKKARQAYLAANRADEWRSYLEELIRTHARKTSLRPQLEALRK